MLGLSVTYIDCDESKIVVKEAASHNTQINVLNSSANKVQELKIINFMNATINKPLSKRFIIKNNSGINTKFSINSERYKPIKQIRGETKINILSTPIPNTKLSTLLTHRRTQQTTTLLKLQM